MNAAQAVICLPVHAFRLVRKIIKHARAPTQSNSDFLRLPKPSVTGRFLLARVCKPITVAAREQATNTVKLGDPFPAIDRSALPPSDTRLRHSCLRNSQPAQVPGETQQGP